MERPLTAAELFEDLKADVLVEVSEIRIGLAAALEATVCIVFDAPTDLNPKQRSVRRRRAPPSPID